MNLLAQSQIINLSPSGDSGKGSNFSPLGDITIPGIVSGGITLVLIIAGVIFFFMLIYGGIKWIMSGGDKAHTEAARSTVTSALIGLIIVFSAWAIAQLIGTLFGISIIGELALPTFTTK